MAYESCDNFAGMLAHEIGHHINRLGGLSTCEYQLPSWFPVTKAMRRISRFSDDHLVENNHEFYAETWARFLCGENKRTLLRYLDRPLNRLRAAHPEKVRLIEEHRARLLRNAA